MQYVSKEDVSRIAAKLRQLREDFTIVGCCALPFLLDEAMSQTVRRTTDIDFIVEIETRLEYSQIEEEIRELGFDHDIRSNAPRCRWLFDGVTVDIMPTSRRASEFGTRWFEEAVGHPEVHRTSDGDEIHVVGPAYLLAMKLHAFQDRSGIDYRGSKDLEDIVTLLEGCSLVLECLDVASAELRAYVSSQMVNKWTPFPSVSAVHPS